MDGSYGTESKWVGQMATGMVDEEEKRRRGEEEKRRRGRDGGGTVLVRT